MANRYFITGGATANWNDVNSWSETSGGAVGASIPTSSDNAIFDANSLSAPCNLTINAEANCLDLDFSGLDNLLTLTNSAYNLNVYGNLTLTSNTFLATAFTGTGYLQLRATTSVNITSNGCTRGWNRIYFDGVGGTWTNQDDWNSQSANFLLANGTWNTNGKIISIFALTTSAGNKTWELGASTIIINRFINSAPAGLTLNIGTSTFSHTQAVIDPLPVPFYNLHYTSPDWTFYTLVLGENITVTNSLRLVGYSNYRRAIIASNSLGSKRRITCNGTIYCENVDFRDIELIGTSNPVDLSAITGGSGDCGGNLGITFTPAANQYFKHSGTSTVNWSDTTKWFTTSGGSVQGRVPLPQDDAIFDANSFDANCTLNVNVPRIGGLNMDGVSVNLQVTSGNLDSYKDIIANENVNLTAASLYVYGGRNSFNKVGISNIIIITSVLFLYSFSIELSKDLKSTKSIRISDGGSCSFKSNNFNISVESGSEYIYFLPSFTGDLNLGTSTIELKDARDGAFIMVHHSIPSNKLFISNATFVFKSASATTFSNNTQIAGIKAAKKIIVDAPNSVNAVKILNNPAIAFQTQELVISAGSKVLLHNLSSFTIGKLTSNGTPDNKVTIQSTTEGSQATINYTGTGTPFIENVILKDINFTVPVYALNGTNLGNNTNVKYVWKVAKKTMGFPIRLVKDE